MYNLYQYEKQAEQNEKKLNHTKSMKILRKQRKLERNKMCQKYRDRVTDFVSSLDKGMKSKSRLFYILHFYR